MAIKRDPRGLKQNLSLPKEHRLIMEVALGRPTRRRRITTGEGIAPKPGGGLKRNLALPGESNRAKIMGGIGQVQQQTSPIVSEKALEQPVVKPGGITQRIKRSVGRVGRAIREVGIQPSGIATNLLSRKPDTGDRIVSPAIMPKDIQGAITKRIERPSGGGVPTFDKQGKLIGTERKIGTSILTQKDGVDILRGTRPPATQQIDFTRGTAKTGRGVRRGRGDIDIFSTAARLGAHFASPEFQAQQRKARGVTARRKGRRADIKQLDTSIKDTTASIASLNLQSGNEETVSKLQTQLSNLIKQRANIGGKNDAVLNEATRFKKAGFSDEETTSILGRLGAG